MIQLRNVTKTYKIGLERRTVIDNLTINLPTDRLLAIFALPSGGKTTLMHLLSGLLEPTDGEIERFAQVSFPVGYVKALKTRLSSWQNVTYAARVYGADVEEVGKFVARITQFGDLMNESLKKLSLQDRMAFAYTLSYAIPFDTYLIDSAYGAGTPDFRRKCLAMLEARSKTSGVILATSHRAIATRLCDMGGVLHRGKITLYEDIHEAAEIYERLEAEVAMEREMSALDSTIDEDEAELEQEEEQAMGDLS
jgi:capsular polysaccharide transport system ATP-binding protein